MTPTKIQSDKPYIIIFNDVEKKFSKAIWSLLAAKNVQIKEARNLQELKDIAVNATLILVPIFNPELSDVYADIPIIRQENHSIVADIIAFLPQDSRVEDRLRVLALGYDGVFDTDLFDYPAFNTLLFGRIEKGRRNLENRVQVEEFKRFRNALAASPDAFIVLDENNKLFFVSDHYKKTYAKHKNMLVRGLDINDAFDILGAEQGLTPADPQYEHMKAFWSAPKGQIEFTTKDNRIWRLNAEPLSEGQGTIVTTADITRYAQQQKKLEIQSGALSDALEKEQAASAVQKQFVNMVSHEFKTPLAIIDGHAQILQRRAEKLSPIDITERAAVIRGAISRLITMMEGILSSNMLQSGKMTLTPQNVDITALLDDLCNEQLALNGKAVIHRYYESLPAYIAADPKIIMLAAGNVLSNAVKYSKDIITAEVSVTASLEDDMLRIEIKDNGIGIPENEIPYIFDRFYRSSAVSGIPGTGIGLHLCKSLIDIHGGHIEVKSILGEGSRFILYFKLPPENGL